MVLDLGTDNMEGCTSEEDLLDCDCDVSRQDDLKNLYCNLYFIFIFFFKNVVFSCKSYALCCIFNILLLPFVEVHINNILIRSLVPNIEVFVAPSILAS